MIDCSVMKENQWNKCGESKIEDYQGDGGNE